jgi:D-alanyl-D-alanine carboxypeptidase
VYTTACDQARWIDALFRGHYLSESSRDAILDSAQTVGYGWFKGENTRFGDTACYMTGRAPGYASFVLYLPGSEISVIVLSNVYSSATTTIGYDLAAIALGLPYEPFHLMKPVPILVGSNQYTGSFLFAADFYQPNAVITLAPNRKELSLAWPSGEASALIPIAKDHFLDRSYWQSVVIMRNPTGQANALLYGGFQGGAVSQ